MKRISHLSQRSTGDPGPSLLFGSAKNMSRSELISQLPSRYSCDIMVTRFFAHLYPALRTFPPSQESHVKADTGRYTSPIIVLQAGMLASLRPICLILISSPAQYERFWDDESKTSTAWVALLFAILRIAMLDYLREGDEPQEYKGKCQDLANTFRSRLTDCLILADYTRPQDFLIEALCLHLYGEYVSSRDAKSSAWVLSGMLVRLALRMGYHQHSQPALTLTPFQVNKHRYTPLKLLTTMIGRDATENLGLH